MVISFATWLQPPTCYTRSSPFRRTLQNSRARALYPILEHKTSVVGCCELPPRSTLRLQLLFSSSSFVSVVISPRLQMLMVIIDGAIIVTRHLNIVKQEKRANKEFRENFDSAFKLQKRSHTYTPVPRSDLERGPQDEEFNPYVEVDGPGHSRNPSDLARQRSIAIDPTLPAVPVEVGYGGGSWTHSDISEEEKTRLRRAGSSSANSHEPQLSDEERNRRRSEHKLINPPDVVPVEPLPEYTPPPRH